VDFATAEEVLKTAALVVVPEDQTQRQAFEKLMPHLYVLRNKGCSWAQLAKLLAECGFKLQPSTVRSYFTEMLAGRLDVCQTRMNEQIAIMAAVRSETAGVDLAAISGRVQAHQRQLQQSAASRLDALFGSSPTESAPRIHKASAPAPQLNAPPVPAISRRDAAPAHLTDEEGSHAPAGEFGLLGLPASASRPARGGPAFFDLDTEPPAAPPPSRSRKATPAPPPEPRQPAPRPSPAALPTAPALGSSKKRLARLQDGVPPLKRRENVPAHVYEPGELEHPAIPGLMLSLEHRLYGASLEYFEVGGPDEGEIKVETSDQKRFRVVWRQSVPMTKTRTAESFTQMDNTLFKR
jgi:hypothetical protein